MAELDQEISAYDGMRSELEARHMGKWVLVHDFALIGVYDSFESVAEDAVCRFGRGPYLIRQVGAPPLTLPASVMYRPEVIHPDHGNNENAGLIALPAPPALICSSPMAPRSTWTLGLIRLSDRDFPLCFQPPE